MKGFKILGLEIWGSGSFTVWAPSKEVHDRLQCGCYMALWEYIYIYIYIYLAMCLYVFRLQLAKPSKIDETVYAILTMAPEAARKLDHASSR